VAAQREKKKSTEVGDACTNSGPAFSSETLQTTWNDQLSISSPSTEAPPEVNIASFFIARYTESNAWCQHRKY
jgi:hypothetical protein